MKIQHLLSELYVITLSVNYVYIFHISCKTFHSPAKHVLLMA